MKNGDENFMKILIELFLKKIMKNLQKDIFLMKNMALKNIESSVFLKNALNFKL
jgi:hypothetical protein